MTFFQNLKNAFGANPNPGAAKAPVGPASEATPPAKAREEAVSADNRLLTLEPYVEFGGEGNRRHTFVLRYAAYGEKSNMMCSALHAGPTAAQPSGPPNALTTSIDLEGLQISPTAAARAQGVKLSRAAKIGLDASAEFGRLRMDGQRRQLARLDELLPLSRVILPRVPTARFGPAELDILADALSVEPRTAS